MSTDEVILRDILDRLGELQHSHENVFKMVNTYQKQTFMLTSSLRSALEHHEHPVKDIKGLDKIFLFSGVLAGVGVVVGWLLEHVRGIFR